MFLCAGRFGTICLKEGKILILRKMQGKMRNMKNYFDKKKAIGVQNSVKDIMNKTKSDNYLRRLKKYNPLFLEQYQNEGFNIPNMIMIVDDAIRRDIDVCEGAIG